MYTTGWTPRAAPLQQYCSTADVQLEDRERNYKRDDGRAPDRNKENTGQAHHDDGRALSTRLVKMLGEQVKW